MKKHALMAGLLLVGLIAGANSAAAGGGSEYAPTKPNVAGPRYMVDTNHALVMSNGAAPSAPVAIQPPPFCCIPGPEQLTGKLPVPTMGNMSYFGGPIQVTPTIYVVFWGWGQSGAFDHTTPGMPANDPDGAAARMLAFVKAIGGTHWADVQTQYYQQNADGSKTYVTNPKNQFGGVWYDDTNATHANVTGLELAQEAARAATHFGVTDFHNSQFIIAQPQKFSEKGFNDGVGYCAWHDMTNPTSYPGVKTGIAFTNMPYVLNMGSSCGEHSVNTGFYAGQLDGFTIVLGHEIEETVTDPGAGETLNGVDMSGWYDDTGFENGDKCAWAGYLFGGNDPSQFPGGLQNIKGNDGKLYPIQTMWSNNAAGGAGYCAGGNNDLPG